MQKQDRRDRAGRDKFLLGGPGGAFSKLHGKRLSKKVKEWILGEKFLL